MYFTLEESGKNLDHKAWKCWAVSYPIEKYLISSYKADFL